MAMQLFLSQHFYGPNVKQFTTTTAPCLQAPSMVLLSVFYGVGCFAFFPDHLRKGVLRAGSSLVKDDYNLMRILIG